MRCDANVSVRRSENHPLGTRTETKNINSFRFLEQAINYEVERQIQVLESGGRVTQETRLYDPDRNETRPMRSKETAMDYRYFPEPDLLPVVIDDSAALEDEVECPAHGLVLSNSLLAASYTVSTARSASRLCDAFRRSSWARSISSNVAGPRTKSVFSPQGA